MNYLSEIREFSKKVVGLNCPKCNQANLYINSKYCSECGEECTQEIDSEKLRFALFALDMFIKYENEINNSCANLIKMFNLSGSPIQNILRNNVLKDLKTIIISNNLMLGCNYGNVKVENGTTNVSILKQNSTPDSIKSLATVSMAIQLILDYPLNNFDIVENPYLETVGPPPKVGVLKKIRKWFS